MPIIFENVSKAFGERRVLEGLNAEFPEKGGVCLFGESASGKSTCLGLLARLFLPDRGQISFGGVQNASCVFQQDALLPWLTVGQNVELGPSVKRRKDVSSKELLERLQIEEYEKVRPDALSGGTKRRTAIARALLMDCHMYLLDEPFTGLDEGLKQKTAALIKELVTDAGRLLVMASHSMEEIALLCNSVYRIESKPITRFEIVSVSDH